MKVQPLFLVCLLLWATFACKKTEVTEVATAPKEGLIAYFPFDGNANDLSGNNNNGTPTNVTYTTDRFNAPNKAVKFGGFNNRGYVRVPNSNSLKLTDQLTISIWFRLDDWGGMDGYGNLIADGRHTLVCKDGDRMGWEFKINGTADGTIEFANNRYVQPSILTEYKSATDPYKGKWVQAVYVLGSNMSKLFVNGALVQTYPNLTINFERANGSDLMFGNYGQNIGAVNPYTWYPLNGALDNARIYNRALTDAEVQQVYQAEKP